MPKIIGAVLARNEAAPDRYLKRVLDNMFTFCDEVVVLDDGSTDKTATICATARARVHGTSSVSSGFWGENETSRRAHLWNLAAELGEETGWIYVADADHELIGITPDEIRALTTTDHLTAWAWPLLDCWDSDETHRIDGYWQAWRMPRAWMFRACPHPTFEPTWQARGIHSGHCPTNFPLHAGLAPGHIRHLGYINPTHRQAKLERYMELA